MTDDELLEGFAANTLDAFPHERHLEVVHLAATRWPEAQVVDFVRAGIQRMAAANGNPGAYHETRTLAWVRRVIAAGGGEGSFAALLAAHPELVRRDLLDEHYSPELLNSDEARTAFVAPDRAPLPEFSAEASRAPHA